MRVHPVTLNEHPNLEELSFHQGKALIGENAVNAITGKPVPLHSSLLETRMTGLAIVVPRR